VRLRQRLVAVALACVASAAGLFIATPAQAWVWDPHVRISGFASCRTGPYSLSVPASEITIRVRATGETRTVPVNSVSGYYAAEFYQIPLNGSWADETIHCKYPGTDSWRYGRAAFMFRPSFGIDIWGYNMTA
jgi:hypothetical protein